MEFLSSVRTIFAGIDIFIAGMISKIYLLILQIADANVINGSFSGLIERIYGIIGLFMLFKLALVIINYIITPDKVQPVNKILTKIIIALILIPTVPEIFNKAYELQGIILKENIIGDIILGDEKSIDNDADEMKKIGDQVGYLVFSNFVDYNTEGDLAKVFTDCPNIFMETDLEKKREVFATCAINRVYPSVPRCAYYLYFAPFSYPDAKGNYPDSRDLYYTCKSGEEITFDDVTSSVGANFKYTGEVVSLIENWITERTGFESWTMMCGIRDGKYIYDLINSGRDNASVETILSTEIITAIESDGFFLKNPVCMPETNDDSGGDFVFEYNYFIATLVGIFVTFLLIVIAVDISIRTIKLAFLQVISPIPIISYIDVNGSKLFNGWIKETISTFLQLFIRLAVVFFSILLFKWLMGSSASNDIMVNVFMIIGILLFTLQMPKLLCNIFNLKSDGFMQLIKDVGKFAIGVAAIGVSSVGGAVSNAAASKNNFKNALNNASSVKDNLKNLKDSSGASDKVRALGGALKGAGGVASGIVKIPGSIVAGGISSGARTAKKIIGNKGNYKSGDISSSIHESSLSRERRNHGISNLTQDDIKSQIKALETEQANLNNSYEQSQEYLALKLASENNATNIEKAFDGDGYNDYDDYVTNMSASGNTSEIISETKYNEYNSLYSKRNKQTKQLDELEEKIELLNSYIKEK